VTGVEIRGNRFPTLPTASVCNQQIVVGGYPDQHFAGVVIAGNEMYAYAEAVRVFRSAGRIEANTVTHPPNPAWTACGVQPGQEVTALDSPNMVVAHGPTTVTPTSAEPGDQVTVSASALTVAEPYVVKLATSPTGCHTGVTMGGPVVSSSTGTVGPTTRTLPVNTTPGQRYVCWVNQEDLMRLSNPASLIVF
jgi:hypothetical protein